MKIKSTWNLELLYKSSSDPEIEKDIQTIEKACSDFEKKYKGKDFIQNSQTLVKALADKEQLTSTINGSKPWWYFALKTDLQSDDSASGATATKIMQRLDTATNKIAFFKLAIASIVPKKQKEYLADSILEPYRYSLKRIFSNAEYNLSEKEEQLQNLLSQTSYTMWVDAQQRLLSQQTVDFKKEKVAIAKAFSILPDQLEKDRVILNEKINEVLRRQSPFAEAEINAIFNYKKVMDELRGYKKPYSATVLGYENDEKTIETLIEVVTKYFSLSHKFYSLHAKLLGKKVIMMADRSVKIGTIKKKFNFETAVDIVRNAFNKVDTKYGDIMDTFLKNGQIDVYPRKGKRGGAYCWGMGSSPTFVLLNHADNINSVETLAHEMGHAIHTELSKQQPARYQKYSTATAEVASTFFEQLIGDELEQFLSEDEKIILLHNKIMGDNMATIFRQIACFNFENELHQKIRKEGQVNSLGIAELLQKHLKSYTGKSVDVTKDDGYFYVTWSHIRTFFYVYSYAYGQLVSRALYERWKADPLYAKKIEQFLSAGRSMSPEDIFKSIGITIDAGFFETGLKAIESDIKKLEKLSKKWIKNRVKK